MFEDLSPRPPHEAPPPESIIVCGAENGAILIRQRGADQSSVVVPPDQAEGLIAAIRRHLDAAK